MSIIDGAASDNDEEKANLILFKSKTNDLKENEIFAKQGQTRNSAATTILPPRASTQESINKGHDR